MKRFARSTIVLSLLGTFLIGAVTGGVVALGVAKAKIEKTLKMENLEDTVMAWAEDHLELTSEQVVRIRPLVEQGCNEYRAELAGTMQRIMEIKRVSNRRIEAELTPAQATKLREFERKDEADLERKFKVTPPPRP
jgi:hypothetical protein